MKATIIPRGIDKLIKLIALPTSLAGNQMKGIIPIACSRNGIVKETIMVDTRQTQK